MKKIVLLFLVLTSYVSHTWAQGKPCELQISLLTCAPGEELYSTFGHSALRVQDSTAKIDIIFNYGTFQFGPDFYRKFVRGQLLYYVSIEAFSSFKEQYEYESRSMQEQLLQLSCADKVRLFEALRNNATEENKYYRYDFLFDNCSTRLRDIVKANTSGGLKFANILPARIPTFRNLLYTYLDNGAQHWSKFGIDLLLGSRLDVAVTNEQAMFLPDYLLKGIAAATTSDGTLALPPQTILQTPPAVRGTTLLQPMVVLSALLIVLIVMSFVPRPGVQRTLAIFDFCFFLLLGLVGCLLIFMWTATDHELCKDNYNLLWALPTHAVAAFLLRSRGKWISYYLLANIILQAFVLVGWIFLPQQFNLAFMPLVLLQLLRSWLIILKPFTHGNSERAAL